MTDENAGMNTRPLTQTETQILQRHQQRRNQHLQEAQDEHNTLIELVTLIGGSGAEVDLQEGVIHIPENGAGEVEGFDGLEEIAVDESRESGDGDN